MACLHLRFWALAVVQHAHAKASCRAPGQGFADAAHANDAQGLAMHVTAKMRRPQVGLPMAVTHPVRQLHHPPGGSQNQGKAGVGSGFGEHVRCVGQHHATPAEFANIVVVHAHRNAGHHFQLRRQVQQTGIQAQAGPQQPVSPRQRIAQAGQAIGQGGIHPGHLNALLQACHQVVGQAFVQHDSLLHCRFPMGSWPAASYRAWPGQTSGMY